MTEARSISALALVLRPGWHGAQSGVARLTLCERRGGMLLLVRGRTGDAEFASGVEAALGAPLPTTPGTGARAHDHVILWLGPDEWLVHGRIAPAKVAALARCAAALTDISHGRTVVRVVGASARALLAKGLPIDLHPRAFGVSRCAQSTLARCNVIVHQVDEAPTFDIYVMRSYGRSLWHFLTCAAAELGYEVVAAID